VTGRLEGKVALVTGAARGQGRSHAVALAREGADIIAIDICRGVESITDYLPASPADLAATVELVEALDRRVVSRQVDIRDRTPLATAVAEGVTEQFRPDLEHPTRADAELGFRAMHRLPTTYIQPSDISNAVVFLASEESRFITGLQMKVEARGLLGATTSGAPA
jgi:NAD(P)-dependent dehydrogenase (short-subunit alcohol dehydrogenase family)